MTQPLNFTVKAAEAIGALESPYPGASAGFRYIASKLREAQVFLLPDYGSLLDRDVPRPELPGEMYRPPFPVVALEYTATGPGGRVDERYTEVKSSRRIALAFDWQQDLPPELAKMCAPDMGPGIVIVSVFYADESGLWMPVSAAAHLSYEDAAYRTDLPSTPFRDQMIASGRLGARQAKRGGIALQIVPLVPEAIFEAVASRGVMEVMDSLQADLMDEVNAYLDLCCALGCKNVTPQRVAAPEKLNRRREKIGKPPLPDHHVLVLGDMVLGAGSGFGTGASRRAHLRRGHIRRLGEQRITWVNQAFVSGRGEGFADKSYRMNGPAR